MTKEEENAINIIKEQCYVFDALNLDYTIMVNTALDMAIKALEFDIDKHDEEVIKNTVESIWGEPCGDCIDRKALGLTDFEILMCNGDYKKALEMLLKKIEDAPAVQPKQRVGRWERTEYSPGLCNYHCSECHNISLDIGNYCPNCGAKMEE